MAHAQVETTLQCRHRRSAIREIEIPGSLTDDRHLRAIFSERILPHIRLWFAASNSQRSRVVYVPRLPLTNPDRRRRLRIVIPAATQIFV